MPDRGEALRHRRREQVLAAALRCFAEQGFHRTSMADVVAASGMSAGSVYRYYDSKTELIRAGIAAVMTSAGAALQHPEGQSPVPPAQALGQLIEQTLALGTRFEVDVGRLAINAWAEAMRDPTLMDHTRQLYMQARDELTDIVARWRDAGNLPPDTDAEAVGRVLFSAFPGYIVQAQLLGDVPVEQYVAGWTALLGPRAAVATA